jgi:putative lipoic acid-binding regulatory protein
MGWASGSELADDVWKVVKKYIPKDKKKEVAIKIVDLFQDYDADAWENDGIAKVAYPEWFEED